MFLFRSHVLCILNSSLTTSKSQLFQLSCFHTSILGCVLLTELWNRHYPTSKMGHQTTSLCRRAQALLFTSYKPWVVPSQPTNLFVHIQLELNNIILTSICIAIRSHKTENHNMSFKKTQDKATLALMRSQHRQISHTSTEKSDIGTVVIWIRSAAG